MSTPISKICKRYPYEHPLRSAYAKGLQAARFHNGASITYKDYRQRAAFYDGLIDGGAFEYAIYAKSEGK